jgi:peptidoglycan/xylan/chitin deacetylase (PgdA/CDA1 family)
MIEEATDIVFRRVFGDPAALRVHLQRDDVVELVSLGWEVGNHTYRHDVLSLLSREQVSESIEANEAYWEALDIRLLPCVAFPNGAAKHVGDGIKSYLDENPGFHGMFCNGGVNLTPKRTEWLRIPVSNMSTSDFATRLATELRISREAMKLTSGCS